MKKILYMLIICICFMGTLTSCGKSLNVERDTVYVQKKGEIISVSVEKLDKDYYESDELKEFVDERVETYTADHEKDSVKVDKFSVDKESAKLHIKYAGYEDYAGFNEVDFFEGMVSQALAAGYDFDVDFSSVEEGEKKEGAKLEDITGNSDHKVVILSEKMDVKVDGEIVYVSSNLTKISAKDTVSIETPEEGEESAQSLTYVVYK